jgi:hypothetical protein
MAAPSVSAGRGTAPGTGRSHSIGGPVDGDRRPVSFGLAGDVGVCGLVADGYTFP